MTSDKNQLVFGILRFFEDELLNSSMEPDTRETLEVASQCLENVYKINSSDAATKEKYKLPATLLEIFKTGLKQKLEEKISKGVSEEDKAKADSYKSDGNTKMKAEQFHEAIEAYTKAIDIDPYNAVYFCNRAAAYSKLNNHSDALQDCNKALEIDPNYSKAFGRKGLAHSALNQHQEASQSFEKAVELDPSNESYKKNLEIAEQKLAEQSISGGGGGGFPGPGGFPAGFNLGNMDFASLLNNPALMNMATQMMSNPEMQQMMANMMSTLSPQAAAGNEGDAGTNPGAPPDLSNLFQMGQQMASQFQQSHPHLVDQLRQQTQPESTGSSTDEAAQQNPSDKKEDDST